MLVLLGVVSFLDMDVVIYMETVETHRNKTDAKYRASPLGLFPSRLRLFSIFFLVDVLRCVFFVSFCLFLTFRNEAATCSGSPQAGQVAWSSV